MLQFNEAYNLDIEIRFKENCGKNSTLCSFILDEYYCPCIICNSGFAIW